MLRRRRLQRQRSRGGGGAERRMVLSLNKGTALPRLRAVGNKANLDYTARPESNWRGRWEGIKKVGGNGAGEVGGEKQQSKMNLKIPSRNLSLCKLITIKLKYNKNKKLTLLPVTKTVLKTQIHKKN